jgi:hypothetical protein
MTLPPIKKGQIWQCGVQTTKLIILTDREGPEPRYRVFRTSTGFATDDYLRRIREASAYSSYLYYPSTYRGCEFWSCPDTPTRSLHVLLYSPSA